MIRLRILFATIALLVGSLFLAQTIQADANTPLHDDIAHNTSQHRPLYAQLTLDYYDLLEQVAPEEGTTIQVEWGDLGRRLVDAGAIDLQQLASLYGGFTEEQFDVLQGDSLEQITFTRDNIRFWTNVLWALGLSQQSKVLSEGPIQQYSAQMPIDSYASTGGWTLGVYDSVTLYNSTQYFALTPEQDDLVYRVAERIFRPCCGNHTAFPDCNHGMAVLGLLELLASQGATEEELFDAALVFNHYAFPETYVTLAAYFARYAVLSGPLSAEAILAANYSSGEGARWVTSVVGAIPGSPNQAGNCGA